MCRVKSIVNKNDSLWRVRLLQDAGKTDIIRSDRALSAKDVDAINAALAANMRVEIVLTAKGIKIYHVKRKELNS